MSVEIARAYRGQYYEKVDEKHVKREIRRAEDRALGEFYGEMYATLSLSCDTNLLPYDKRRVIYTY